MSASLDVAAERHAVDAAKRLLVAEGYVVVKAKSYQRAQERQRVAEALLRAAERRTAEVEAWARRSLDEERRLRDRMTEIVAFAMEHGASYDDLRRFNGLDAAAETHAVDRHVGGLG